MRSDFELDSQLLAWEVLLRTELHPRNGAAALQNKRAAEWIADMERQCGEMIAAWRMFCGDPKYRKKYIGRNLKRHIGISRSLQKTLLRYLEMDEVCKQVYLCLQNCLNDLLHCLEIEHLEYLEMPKSEQPVKAEHIKPGEADTEEGEEWLPTEAETAEEAAERRKYERVWPRYVMLTRLKAEEYGLLLATLIHLKVFELHRGEQKIFYMFFGSHTRTERTERLSWKSLRNHGATKDLDVLKAIQDLALRIVKHIDMLMTQIMK